MEVTVNVQGFEELKRVLSNVHRWDFNISNWHRCACGHATRDEWFRRQGFTNCNSFDEAAAFFGITYERVLLWPAVSADKNPLPRGRPKTGSQTACSRLGGGV